ncbi:MAG: hypothetical protein OXH72_06695 [Caldilineaceae bacterium]|nr:hypothetical protein [Caldilineaceae bacterium]
MAIAGNGIRVWVDDDQLIINRWQGQTAALVDLDHARAIAWRMVQVEYFDAADEATATINWTVEE